MEIKGVYLILADINSYTPFVRIHQASVLHAGRPRTRSTSATIHSASAR